MPSAQGRAVRPRNNGGPAGQSFLRRARRCPGRFYARGQNWSGNFLLGLLFRRLLSDKIAAGTGPDVSAKRGRIARSRDCRGDTPRGIVTRKLVFRKKLKDTRRGCCRARYRRIWKTFFLSLNQRTRGCNVTADLSRFTKEAALLSRNPAFTQIHPHLHPGQWRISVEAHAHGPNRCGTMDASGFPQRKEDRNKAPGEISENRSRLLSRAKISELRGNLAAARYPPRAQQKEVCDEGRGVGPGGNAAVLSRLLPTRFKPPGVKIRFASAMGKFVRGSMKRSLGEDRLQSADADFTRPCTTRWAVSGWIYDLMSNVSGFVCDRRRRIFFRSRRQTGSARSALMQGAGRWIFCFCQNTLPELSGGADGGKPAVAGFAGSSKETEKKMFVPQSRNCSASTALRFGRLPFHREAWPAFSGTNAEWSRVTKKGLRARRSKKSPELREQFWSRGCGGTSAGGRR